jgi:hypothetical protein
MSDRSIGEFVELAQQLGVEDEQLDELVHDEYSRMASSLNNEGRDAQVAFLLERWTADGLREEFQRLAGGER